jgi:hypothetical protein
VKADHDHQPVGSGFGVGAKLVRDLLDRACEPALGIAGEPVVEALVTRSGVGER